MASHLNWALIQEGSTFQSLINSLLSFEIPSVRLFGRAGRDGAQDAISPDGKTVFQDKFHTRPAISATISDALNEKEKIEKYRTATDRRDVLWKDVTHWVLVTNLAINPNDEQRWLKEVVPEFQALGLIAELWGIEKLTALLTKFPHVAEAYFEGKNRCFLSFPEAIASIKSTDVTEGASDIDLVGRDKVLDSVRTFLKGNDKILCLHGAGGIGKTRILTETGFLAQEEAFQVLWALESTMMNTPTWFSSLGLAQDTVLLIDEPRDPALIRILSEQMRLPTSQMKKWKLVISLRSPKDPVMLAIEQLEGSLKATTIGLAALTPEEAQLLALKLLDKKSLFFKNEAGKRLLAGQLSKLADKFPVWIVLAVEVYSIDQTLAENPTVGGIASAYVDEVIQHSPGKMASKEQFQTILRWLALYEEIDTDDAGLTQFVALETGMGENIAKLQECLRYLSSRKFLVRRGLKQTRYSIKPDVIRDFILRTWLVDNVDNELEPTTAARALVNVIIQGKGGKPLPKAEIVIKSLARLEISEKLIGRAFDLLSPLVDEVKQVAETGGLKEVQAVIELASRFAFARILDVVEVSATVRTRPREPIEVESLFGKFQLTHADVVKELPWVLYEASQYAFLPTERENLFHELQELVIFEGEHPGIVSNDGKSASALLERITSDPENSPISFEVEGFNHALVFLSRLNSKSRLAPGELKLLRVLCLPHLKIERRQTTFDRHKLTVRSWSIRLNGPAGKRRTKIREEVRLLLASGTEDHGVAGTCWALLSDAHASGNRQLLNTKDQDGEHVTEVRADVLDDLRWAWQFLSSRSFTLFELRAARGIWNWHARYEKNDELRKVAAACEQIYQTHPLVRAFEVFFDFERYTEVQPKAEELAKEFIDDLEPRAMSFLAEAEVYAPNGDFNALFTLADSLADKWAQYGQIKTFVYRTLKEEPKRLPFRFGCRLLNVYLRNLRAGFPEAITGILNEMIAIPPTPHAQLELLANLYSRPHPLITGLCDTSDFAFVRGELARLSPKAEIQCQILAGFYHVDWAQCRGACDNLFNLAHLSDKPSLFVALLEAVTFLALFVKDYPKLRISAEQADWFIELLLQLPDIDSVSDSIMWRVKHLGPNIQSKTLSWLNQAIRARIELAKDYDDDDAFQLIPTQQGLTHFVIPVADTDEPTNREIRVLLNHNSRKDLLGYALPGYATSIDPKGLIIPETVASKIREIQSPTVETVWLWARFAGHYAFNSASWRTIARAAIVASQNLPPKDRGSIFVAIMHQGITSSSYPAGEMDPRPLQELDQRRKEFESECDPTFRPFREWALMIAQSKYERVLAEFEEESAE